MENPSPLTRYVRPRRGERAKRVRLGDKLVQLRSTVAALERALPVILTLDDASDVDWTGFLEPTALSLRRRMLGTLQLTKQAQELATTQRQLQRLLREHRMASRVIAGFVLRATPEDDWYTSTARWHALARHHFVPWTLEKCEEEMQAARREINAYQRSTDKQTTGVTFLGWRDSRRVDPVRSMLQFDFHKRFHGQDLETYVARTWEAYTDSRLFQEIIVGPHVRSSHTVLQRFGSNMLIAMGSQRSASLTVDVHMLFLVYLDQTESGVTLCVRSINTPELMKAFNRPSDVWGSNAYSARWERLPGKATQAFDFRVGGTIGGVNAAFVAQWMTDAFGAVLRMEQRATGRCLLTSE